MKQLFNVHTCTTQVTVSHMYNYTHTDKSHTQTERHYRANAVEKYASTASATGHHFWTI